MDQSGRRDLGTSPYDIHTRPDLSVATYRMFFINKEGSLDEVFDAVRYQDVTTPGTIELAVSVTPLVNKW
jgi:hypothetical protein